MVISWRLISSRTPFVSTVRSMKAPEKPALINTMISFESGEQFEFNDLQNLFCEGVGGGSTILCAVVLVGFGSLKYLLVKSIDRKMHQVVPRKRQPMQLIRGRVQPCEERWPPSQHNVINHGLEEMTGKYRVVGWCFIRVVAEPTHSGSSYKMVGVDVIRGNLGYKPNDDMFLYQSSNKKFARHKADVFGFKDFWRTRKRSRRSGGCREEYARHQSSQLGTSVLQFTLILVPSYLSSEYHSTFLIINLSHCPRFNSVPHLVIIGGLGGCSDSGKNSHPRDTS